LAIARAVAEYIHTNPRLGAKTLFATHYHELVELAGFLPRARNFNVAVTEEHGEVVFLRKIVPGGVDKSYGIHVAKLAGLPKPVIQRAQAVLSDLEESQVKKAAGRSAKSESKRADPGFQMTLFGPKPAVLDDLEKLDIDSLSPLEALNKLYELQKKSKEH
jgi:DNA mismatch repair protein MutS